MVLILVSEYHCLVAFSGSINNRWSKNLDKKPHYRERIDFSLGKFSVILTDAVTFSESW